MRRILGRGLPSALHSTETLVFSFTLRNVSSLLSILKITTLDISIDVENDKISIVVARFVGNVYIKLNKKQQIVQEKLNSSSFTATGQFLSLKIIFFQSINHFPDLTTSLNGSVVNGCSEIVTLVRG